MLIIVIEKPIQFTIVSEVPLVSDGALCATSVESNGESAMTTNPQRNKKDSNRIGENDFKKSGAVKQHNPDINNHNEAIFFVPKRCESKPLITQAIPPKPIIRKENKDTFKLVFGL